MKRLNKLVAILFLLIPVKVFCQEFSHTAKLDSVTASGFYIVNMIPELTSRLHPTLNDLRLVDAKGVQVPYILKTSLPELKNDDFKSLSIVENSIDDSGYTHFVIDNNTKANLHELAFVVRNSTVSRTARLSGSDDGKKWFAIAEDIQLNSGYNSDNDRFVLNVNFPLSSYRYFKLIINNLKNDPLNIVTVEYKVNIPWKRWNYDRNNPDPVFHQIDSSDGITYVKVIQSAPFHITQLRVYVDKPRFYKRRMEVLSDDKYADFIISPAASSYSIPVFNSKAFILKIFNGDNPPLKIASITTAQEMKYIIAYLEKGESYSLLMGNPQATMPSYDLAAFNDSIPKTLGEIKVHQIQARPQKIKTEAGENNISLWLIIIGVLGILSFFTWNLTKELKKRNQ